MELEERYIVFKIKRLTEGERARLEDFIYWNNIESACYVPCLVIEKDWPEYEPTLALLSERVDGK
jgi:hypothetical protein